MLSLTWIFAFACFWHYQGEEREVDFFDEICENTPEIDYDGEWIKNGFTTSLVFDDITEDFTLIESERKASVNLSIQF